MLANGVKGSSNGSYSISQQADGAQAASWRWLLGYPTQLLGAVAGAQTNLPRTECGVGVLVMAAGEAETSSLQTTQLSGSLCGGSLSLSPQHLPSPAYSWCGPQPCLLPVMVTWARQQGRAEVPAVQALPNCAGSGLGERHSLHSPPPINR